MHIPLDYYRVLGLPIQATSSQLSHAHRDRTLQLPRREFSEWAIAARRQLIDEAYEVLSDPVQRQNYDASFFSKPYNMEVNPSPDIPAPSVEALGSEMAGANASEHALSSNVESTEATPVPRIEIHDHQFIGALLLLYELGEYELALRLGRPYLSSGDQSLGDGQLGDPQIVAADIVLTIALSCLELGREQWQQGQYEAAAESLETGQELLLREGLFASVRGEIQTDLYKLRPYRILELLALPEERKAERYQGLRLLHDILQERGGIDGKGNDQSGLNTDDFLRFIQQLRTYLAVTEQQQVFETEAKRPSAVGTYLTVYTMIAGGFAHRQPALIQSAKQYLSRLGNRQDVRLEQSICALLLGQTEEANYLVEHSHEQETLAYIRKHSADSPDLLPGLCLYTEQWFRSEVFPQFRDLVSEDASLKGYFADASVQAYLEALPVMEEHTMSASMVARASAAVARFNGQETTVAYQRGDRAHTHNNTHSTHSQHSSTYNQTQAGESIVAHSSTRAGSGLSATATRDGDDRSGNATLPPAQRVSQLSPEGRLSPPQDTDLSGAGTSPRGASSQPTNVPFGTTLTPSQRGQTRPRMDRLLLLAALGIVGLLIMWLIASRIYAWISQVMRPPLLPGEQLELQLNQAPMPIPAPAALYPLASDAEGEVTVQVAEDVIRLWLDAKQAAMGPDHDVSLLADILIGQNLANWQNRAVSARQNDFYLNYKYPVLSIDEVVWSDASPDVATVTVTITEVGEFYKAGERDQSESYNSPLNVVYGIVRDDGRWKIQTSSIQ
ncbi:MAG: DUF4101 domain-containing protein [Cyanothece sp. SIO2G6]|nr:DUF4101 domain-containing protein [Cyanothece sp. SIO2G6]